MVQPNSSASIGAVPLDVLLRDKDMKGIKDTKEVVFYTELKLGRRILSRNTLYFEPVKNLHLEKPLIKKSIRATADGYSITLSADRLAKNVYLSVDQKGAFSDNFFDLMPGEVHTISFVTTLRSDTFDACGYILILNEKDIPPAGIDPSCAILQGTECGQADD
jgi:beta-galactosidase/beta-glucuronidase